MKKALILGDSNTWGYDPRGYFQRYDLTYKDYLNDLVAGWMFFEDSLNGRLLRDVKDETYDLASINRILASLNPSICIIGGQRIITLSVSIESIKSCIKETI